MVDVPPKLAQWRIGEPIGRGSSCTVYLAYHEDSHAAAKAIDLPRHLDAGTPCLQRLRTRLDQLRRLRHPAINTPLDWCISPQEHQLWLILPLLTGQSLWQGARLRDFARATGELARGLSTCHDQGVLHGDIKPENVFIEPDGGPVLLDFALPLPPGEGSDFSPDAALGSPGWLAPECFLGSPADRSTDIYALGQILVESARGQLAFPSLGKGLASLLHLSDLKSRTPFLDPGEGVDEPLRSLLRRATARDPQARPSAAELAQGAETSLSR